MTEKVITKSLLFITFVGLMTLIFLLFSNLIINMTNDPSVYTIIHFLFFSILYFIILLIVKHRHKKRREKEIINSMMFMEKGR